MPLSSATWSSTCPASATMVRPSMTILTGRGGGADCSLIVIGDRPRDGVGWLSGPEVQRLFLPVDVLDRPPTRTLPADSLLELQESVDHRFGPRRTAGHVAVDRAGGVDPLHH